MQKVTSKYVHATSRGHEAVQLALSMQLKREDWVAPYNRDDSILLGIGITPYELMLQLHAKKDDIFSGGRTYYCHPSLNRDDMPKIPHQSSATGMQAIPTTGVAMGIQYIEKQGIRSFDSPPVVVCSFGDASVTEGEVAEALQMAALKQYPILYFVQDNEWDISATSKETRAQNAAEYAQGFKGIEVRQVEGNDFQACYFGVRRYSRNDSKRATSHFYFTHLSRCWVIILPVFDVNGTRDDLEEHQKRDPLPKFHSSLLADGFTAEELEAIRLETRALVDKEYEEALNAADPDPADLFKFDYAPTPITEEKGIREPEGKEPTLMVDSALFAVQEILAKHPEALLYGQDVGGRLGGVFREAATLAQKFGDDRVFNTPIQEAFIVGSTVGLSCLGLKPIVEVQFADYIWPGLNQLFTEVSRSYYLSNGKWPGEQHIACSYRRLRQWWAISLFIG